MKNDKITLQRIQCQYSLITDEIITGRERSIPSKTVVFYIVSPPILSLAKSILHIYS